MYVSYQWLQSFFADPLPDPVALEELLTFHSCEIEGSEQVDGDTVFDVKVLPDKSAWLLSHRGMAREVAAITERTPQRDPVRGAARAEPGLSGEVSVMINDPRCDHYGAALIRGVRVGVSPAWLQACLGAIGQRSINVVVDAANYVMFDMGQPLHAFDAGKLTGGPDHCQIGVRAARVGESITVLTGETYELTPEDLIIVDAGSDTPIGIAGIKGGLAAAVDESTTDLVIEAAHFDRVAVRKTARRLNLRTDAAVRFENGVPRALAPRGLTAAATLIAELTEGELAGYRLEGEAVEERAPVSVSREKINNVLGLSLTTTEIGTALGRFGFAWDAADEVFTVVPPLERDDLLLPEDLVEEVGRLHGFHHIPSIPPELASVREVNTRHYYAEQLRAALTAAGFSEVMTSSFRALDTVKLANALAADKQYLRSRLADNLAEALDRNAPHRDLLGLSAIQLFELGTVFATQTESYHLALGVRTGVRYKAKHDDPRLAAAKDVVATVLGAAPDWTDGPDGVAECALDPLLANLPSPSGYEAVPPARSSTYVPFSVYPSISRDVAIFVSPGISAAAAAAIINEAAGSLCARTTLFDEFQKEGRTSYAFRLVFQSHERTLTDSEVNTAMERVYAAVADEGWEVR